MLWRLPDYLSDLLPQEAAQLEAARRRGLDLFKHWGYELIVPPLLEEADSLLTGTGAALDAVMFRTTDPHSGRGLGFRPDITPQAARIDAHILHRSGVNRLCYCGPVLRTQVNDAFASREQWQLGAELFGYAGIEADIEIQDLALATLAALGLNNTVISLAHSGIFAAVMAQYPALSPAQDSLVAALRAKDLTALAMHTQAAPQALAALSVMAQSWQTADALTELQTLLPQAQAAIAQLRNLSARATAQGATVLLDLADLHGFTYHSGAQLAVYQAGNASPILRGGRYDGIGASFGRPRAATGFSLDLRNALQQPTSAQLPEAIAAPWAGDVALDALITQLRDEGHIVIRLLPGQTHTQTGFVINHAITHNAGQWHVQAISASLALNP